MKTENLYITLIATHFGPDQDLDTFSLQTNGNKKYSTTKRITEHHSHETNSNCNH
jgi:hypothetical protein